MFLREIPCRRMRFITHDQINTALTPQIDILGPVLGHTREAHGFEHGLKHTFFGRTEFNKFKTVKAGWIVEKVSGVLGHWGSHIFQTGYV